MIEMSKMSGDRLEKTRAALVKGRAALAAKREQQRLATGSATLPRINRSTGRSRLNMKALKAKVNIYGVDAINKSTAAGRLLVEWRDELTNALGGPDQTTPQQKCLIEIATRSKLICDHIDWFIMQQETLIFFRKKSVYPIVMQRAQLAAQLEKTLTTLGLNRVAKRLESLAEYSERRAREIDEEAARRKDSDSDSEPIEVEQSASSSTNGDNAQ